MIFFLPFVGLCLSLIFFAYNFNWISITIFLFLVMVMLAKKEKNYLIYLSIGAVLGVVLYYIPNRNYQGEVTQYGLVFKAEGNYFLVLTLKGNFYIKYKGNPYEIGDIVFIRGTSGNLEFSHYQESFDFKQYLNSFSVFRSLEGASVQSKFSSFIRLNAWKEEFLSGYSDESKILISGLVFNSSISDLSSYQSLKDIGLASLISASGIHIGSIQLLLKKFLSRKLNDKQVSSGIFALIFILFIINGYPISILRLLIMNILSILISFKKINSISYVERLSISGFAILLLNPFYVLNIGFFYTYPLLMTFSFFTSLIKYRERFQRVKRTFFFWISILPLNMAVNYALSPLMIIVQLIMAPFISFLYCLDLLVFFKGLTRPFLDRINYLFIKAFSISDKIDFLFVSGKVNPVLIIVIYFLFYVLMVIKEVGSKKNCKNFSLLLICFICFFFLPDLTTHYEVHFIDVGQGDSTLIRYKSKNILVDTGGNIYQDLAVNCLIPYFHSLKIEKLDAVLTTHDDYDHVGALDSLKANFQIGSIFKGGDALKLNFDDMQITDLNTFKVDGAESNYNSAVYSFKILSTSFLIMGDAPVEIEKRIIETYPSLDCDILKMGHHGSSTSSCKDFLEFSSPDKAIISCGLNNIYKHPSKSVMDTLEGLSIPYIRTDFSGTYVYKVSR